MNQIPPQDKEVVVNRLAQGESYSQAMVGTAIKSKDTIHRIAEEQSNTIERKRQEFLEKIKRFGANDEQRAKVWADMITATKRLGKDVEAADWQARATALKYIDSLDDLDKAEEMKLEVNDITPQRLSEISEVEKEDFNSKFRKFIQQQG